MEHDPHSHGAFMSALLDPAAPVPQGLEAWNRSDPRVRFAVHRNNVVHSLVSVLADTFAVTRTLVGEAFFGAMAAEFVRHEPPRSPLMHQYGDRFAAWLAGFEPAGGLPYLPDLARLEFARVVAFHAADAPPLAPQELAHVLMDAPRLALTRLTFAPSLTLLSSRHPVVSIWSAHQRDDVQRECRLATLELDTAEAAMVFRLGDDAVVLHAPQADVELAAALASGAPMGAAHLAHGQANLARLLTVLLQHRLVVGVQCAANGLPTLTETMP